jgi:hypothetical protein
VIRHSHESTPRPLGFSLGELAVTGELVRIDGGGHLWNNSWLLPEGPPAWFTDSPEKLLPFDSG